MTSKVPTHAYHCYPQLSVLFSSIISRHLFPSPTPRRRGTHYHCDSALRNISSLNYFYLDTPCFQCRSDSHPVHDNFSTTRSFSSSSKIPKKRRSPYVVLQLRTSATKDDIKAAFRRLAKKYHPDLNPHVPQSDAQEHMSELIDAYEQLMDDDLFSNIGDARVALACEVYTIDELRMDRLHDVYDVQVLFEEKEEKEGITMSSFDATSSMEATYETSLLTRELTSNPILHVVAHPDDSVSDFKRSLQLKYGKEWELTNRRLDRDKVATGWEIVYCGKSSAGSVSSGHDDGSQDSSTVLSYHLFLSSYGIKNGDILHVVVRRYNDNVPRESQASCS